MPSTIVTETVVYTLAELKEAADAGSLTELRTYEKAVENTIARLWDWFEPYLVTEDIMYKFEYDFPLIYVEKKSLEWYMDTAEISFKGSVPVGAFLTKFNLRNKYRTVWNAMQTFGIDADVPVSFGQTRSRDGNYGYCDIYEFRREFDYVDEIFEDKRRYMRVHEQLDRLEVEIADWMDQVHSAFRKYLRAEETWRNSEEYALQEADALEFQFTEEGKFYRD